MLARPIIIVANQSRQGAAHERRASIHIDGCNRRGAHRRPKGNRTHRSGAHRREVHGVDVPPEMWVSPLHPQRRRLRQYPTLPVLGYSGTRFPPAPTTLSPKIIRLPASFLQNTSAVYIERRYNLRTVLIAFSEQRSPTPNHSTCLAPRHSSSSKEPFARKHVNQEESMVRYASHEAGTRASPSLQLSTTLSAHPYASLPVWSTTITCSPPFNSATLS